MDLRQQLLDQVDAYCARTGMSRARLATLVVNDGKFFARLVKGGGFTVRTYEKFQAFFEAEAGREGSDVA